MNKRYLILTEDDIIDLKEVKFIRSGRYDDPAINMIRMYYEIKCENGDEEWLEVSDDEWDQVLSYFGLTRKEAGAEELEGTSIPVKPAK